MTLSEFISRITEKTPRNLILGVMYFESQFNGKRDAIFTKDDVRLSLRQARIPKSDTWNITDVLSKSGALVDSLGFREKKRLWKLTSSGEAHVRLLVGELDIEKVQDVAVLRQHLDTVKAGPLRDYLEEAVLCLSAGALRAAIVFLWAGAVYLIRSLVMTKPLADINAGITKYQSKAGPITRAEDLAKVQDANLLLLAEYLGIFDKNEKDVLEKHCLDVRNKCGHPGNYSPGPKKVSSVIEDVTTIVFAKS